MNYVRSIALLLTCIFVLPAVAAAQGNWSWLHPRPTGDRFGKIEFVNATVGWAALEHGRVLHTTDGGVTWQVINPDSNAILETITEPPVSMSFVSPTTGWFMTTINGFDDPSGAALYKTTDGGGTWVTQISGLDAFGLAVEFVDASNGWAVTGAVIDTFPNVFTTIHHSTDGGMNWTPQHTTAAPTVVLAVSFLNTTTGWAIIDSLSEDVAEDEVELTGPTTLIGTTDAGANWDTLWTDPAPEGLLFVDFIDANTGWMSGEGGRLLKSTDGGSTWLDMAAPGMGDSTFVGPIFFLDANTGWVGAEFDSLNNRVISIYRTTDGGMNWSQTVLMEPWFVTSIFFQDASNGWLGSENGVFMRTSDGGQTWTDQTERVTYEWMTDVFFANATDGWIAASNGWLFATNDGGCSWTTALSSGWNLNSVFVVDATNGWVVGGAGSIWAYDGIDWTLAVGCCGPDLHAVWALASNDAWAVGFGGRIMHWDGFAWNPDPQSGIVTTQTLNDLWGTGTSLVAVGDAGTIVNYNGVTWSLDPQSGSVTTANLRGVWGTASNNVYAVGDSGTILRYDGISWAVNSSGEFFELQDVWGTSANDVYAVGFEGQIVHDNGTGVFNRVSSGVRRDLYGVGANPSTGVSFAVGNQGSVVSSTPLPVACEIVSVAFAGFFGEYTNGGVKLNWIIRQADGLEGFNVYRSSTGAEGPFLAINGALVRGGRENVFVDGDIERGRTYWYRIGGVDRDGEFFSPVVGVDVPGATLALSPAYPNPFNPSATIAYSLPERGDVVLAIYDVRGQLVRQLRAGSEAAGDHSAVWDGRNDKADAVSSGVYFARLEFDGRVLSRRLVLLK